MFTSLKRNAALAAAAGALTLAGGAIASGTAMAGPPFWLSYGPGGSDVPTNTGFSAGLGSSVLGSSSTIAFTNSSGSIYAQCTGSTLGGATIADSNLASGHLSDALKITSGSFTGCSIPAAGTSITVTGNFTTPWTVNPLNGTGPYTGKIANVSVTLNCGGSNNPTFAGTLTTGGSETNQFTAASGGKAATGSKIGLANAQSLSRTSGSTGCATIPSPVGVTGSYVLTGLNAAPGGSLTPLSGITSSNNLWENG